MYLIAEGSGEVSVDNEVFYLKEDSLLLLPKRQNYVVSSGTGMKGYELCFGDCFWEKTPASANNCKAVLFDESRFGPLVPLEHTHRDEIFFLFKTIHHEASKEQYVNKMDALAAYLKIIMIKVANIASALNIMPPAHEKESYHRFINLLEKNFHHREVADYAIQLNMTARRLSDICRRYGGAGAKEIINNRLVAEAKRLLQFSTQPVKEIAYQLNFSSPEQFSHFFKKYTNVSPQAYRAGFVNSDR
jgi:AraC-like DNA-binding protein